MSITVLKKQDSIRVLQVTGELPDNMPVTFYAPPADAEAQASLDAQMPSFIRGDEEESAAELFPVR